MRLGVLTALTMLAFAANSVLNRMAVASGAIDPQSFALIRLLAGAAILGVLVVVRRGTTGRAVWPGWSGRALGVLGLLSYLICFSAAYVDLSAGTGALVLFGTVQVTMFAGAVLAREPIAARRWLGAGLAFAGLCVLVAPTFVPGGIAPVVLMACAGIGWGVYSLVGRGAVDPVAATAWNFILAVPFGLVAWGVAVWGTGETVLQASGLWLAVISGAVTSGLGYALWYGVLPQLGAARAAVAQLTVPVIAAAGGLALIGEGLSWRFVISAAIVLGGVAVASR